MSGWDDVGRSVEREVERVLIFTSLLASAAAGLVAAAIHTMQVRRLQRK